MNSVVLPWWALIPLTTFTLRSVWTLPLAILQRKRIQKQSQLRPLVSAMNPILKLNLARRVQQAKRNSKIIPTPKKTLLQFKPVQH